MSEEKKLALLIDSDNVSAKYAQFILQEASKYGELTCKRVYGDWEKGGNGWHFPAVNNSILPVQQTCYIAGKNATDFSIIIDAMDLLYSGNVDGFVLVTSDSDFTRLAIRLRESGKLVVGIGEVKTPLAFTSSCHHFSYLNQVCDNVGEYDEKSLRKAVVDFVKEKDDGRLDLAKVNAFLASRYGSIDFSTFGFNRLSSFIDSFPELRRNSTFVSLRKKQPADRSANAAAKHQSSVPSEKEIVSVIAEFLERKPDSEDDISRVNDYVTSTFGKVNFGAFGSKKFAKFIDNHSEFIRQGTLVKLSASSDQTGASTAAVSENKAAVSAFVPETGEFTLAVFVEEVKKYAEENMPRGGNLGQLNNLLLEKYGKNYTNRLGFGDFTAAMTAVLGVTVKDNRVFLSEVRGEASVKADNFSENGEKSENAENPESPARRRGRPSNASRENAVLDDGENSSEESKTLGKFDYNMVKREILHNIANSENGISLPALGKILAEKYGKDYLKVLKVGTMKRLIGQIKGINVRDNMVFIDEDFLKRTDEIEQFVCAFARESDKRSIKMLSSKMKKSFPEFDFTDYGYAKFSDFINAIDGVRANGYYVEPVE